jgi:catechol 2,3-dioxygenase-like lactoylglutathione lyase family enzyme
MIKGLGHTAYNVSDMDKSLHFYCDVLGFKFLFQLKDDNGKPWINYLKVTDHQFVELFFNGTKAQSRDTSSEVGYNHLCLEVDDINQIADDLKGKGIVLDEEIKQGIDLNYQCWISDPDGNRVELMQFHPNAPQLKG